MESERKGIFLCGKRVVPFINPTFDFPGNLSLHRKGCVLKGFPHVARKGGLRFPIFPSPMFLSLVKGGHRRPLFLLLKVSHQGEDRSPKFGATKGEARQRGTLVGVLPFPLCDPFSAQQGFTALLGLFHTLCGVQGGATPKTKGFYI